MNRRVISFVVIAIAWLVAGWPTAAGQAPQQGAGQTPPAGQQTPPPAGQQTFRARVDSVSVDVEVTDKQGNPVRDLTEADFEIREANKVQAIDTFKLIEIDDAPGNNETPPAITSLEAEQRELARDDTRIIVIFLDDYHTRKGNSLRVREQLARWVGTLSDRDLVAVAYPLTPASALTFTYDHDGLARAMMHFEGRKYDYTPRNAYEERYQQSPPEIQEQMRNDLVVGALGSLCKFLGSARDGRKTILYVSEGMTGTIPAGISTSGGFLGPTTTMGTSANQNFASNSSLLTDLIEIFKAAARNNTSIYTLDPRGLTSNEYDINDNVGAQMDRQVLGETTDTLRTLANQTNGRAIVNRNDAGPELRQMLRDSSAYYLLGYTSSLAAHDGKFHPIDVRVKRKDVEVRARKGYWAFSEDEIAKATAAPKPGPVRDVQDALDGLATAVEPSERHPVRVWMGSVRGPKEKAVVTFTWESSAGAAPDAASAVDHLTATATAATGETLFQGPIARDPQAAPRVAGSVAFEAPPGKVRIRFSAETAKGSPLDTDDRSFDVPDYSTPATIITEPLVFRALTARDITNLRAATAPVPTSARAFARIERLLVRFQAYGPAGQTPVVTMRLLNQRGDPMAALPAPTAAAGGYEADIGLAPLAAGDYIIEIAAKVGDDTVRRLLAIRVTG
ncbi:MAG TPA: VWA domain-containing protein [Vicinamibacterales bacterium]|nr:VWA domain-containing protein [Vicinamibacterales bacterium]